MLPSYLRFVHSWFLSMQNVGLQQNAWVMLFGRICLREVRLTQSHTEFPDCGRPKIIGPAMIRLQIGRGDIRMGIITGKWLADVYQRPFIFADSDVLKVPVLVPRHN